MAVEANLKSPPISLDIITETAAVGVPSRIAATRTERGCIPALWSNTTPKPGRMRSLRVEEKKSQ